MDKANDNCVWWYMDFCPTVFLMDNKKISKKWKRMTYLMLKYHNEFNEYIHYVWLSLIERRKIINYFEMRVGNNENGYYFMYLDIINSSKGIEYREIFLIDCPFRNYTVDILIFDNMKMENLQKAGLYHFLKNPQFMIDEFYNQLRYDRTKPIPFLDTCLMYKNEYNRTDFLT